MFKNYALTFDPFQMSDLFPQLIAFVQSNALTYQFIAPYAGSVFVKSSADILILATSYNAFFNGRAFLIAEINAEFTGGRLEQKVWDWLNNANPEPLPFAPLLSN